MVSKSIKPKAKVVVKKSVSPDKAKISRVDAKEIKENMRDVKTGIKRFNTDTQARAENYNKEERYKEGYLSEHLGAPKKKEIIE